MFVIVVREPKPPDGNWGPKARQRYHRRRSRPQHLRRFWRTLCALNCQTCLAFECAHQQWVRKP